MSNKPFEFSKSSDFDGIVVDYIIKSLNNKIPTKVIAHPKDGRSPYLTTVYKNPVDVIEGINDVNDLSEYMKQFSVQIDNNTKEHIEFQHIKDACKAIVDVKLDFPKIRGLLVNLKVCDDMKLNPLKTDIDGSIYLNYHYMAKGNSIFNERMKRENNINFLNGVMTVKDLAYHETGHVILSHLCQHNPELWNKSKLAGNIVCKLYERMVQNGCESSLEDLRAEISQYALITYSEFVCEAIKDVYRNKLKAKILSKKIYT